VGKETWLALGAKEGVDAKKNPCLDWESHVTDRIFILAPALSGCVVHALARELRALSGFRKEIEKRVWKVLKQVSNKQFWKQDFYLKTTFKYLQKL
jgi:hypothetical protein